LIRFQHGSIRKEGRKKGAVWVYPYYATRDHDGKRVERTREQQFERKETGSSRHNEQTFESTNGTDALSDIEVSRDDAECAVKLTGVDLEAHLKRELIELDRHDRTARAVVEERLYQLHQVMAVRGRKSRFTSFLRDELGWSQNRPTTRRCDSLRTTNFVSG
jgi:hypothetical protein